MKNNHLLVKDITGLPLRFRHMMVRQFPQGDMFAASVLLLQELLRCPWKTICLLGDLTLVSLCGGLYRSFSRSRAHRTIPVCCRRRHPSCTWSGITRRRSSGCWACYANEEFVGIDVLLVEKWSELVKGVAGGIHCIYISPLYAPLHHSFVNCKLRRLYASARFCLAIAEWWCGGKVNCRLH